MRVRTRVAAVAAMLALVMAALISSAAGATGPVPPDPLASSTWTVPHSLVVDVPLQSPFTLTLAAGEHRYLVGSVDATLTGVSGAEEQARIRCLDPFGAVVQDELTSTSGGGSWASQNNIGSELQVLTRYLLTASTSGTYSCSLQTKMSSTNETGSTVYTLHRVNGSGSTATYIDDYYDTATGPAWQRWQGQLRPLCTGNDGSTGYCQYVVAGTPASVMSFSDIYPAAGHGVTIYGGLEVSECKTGSQTCYTGYWGGTGSTTVYSYLRTVQLDANGSVCGSWTFSPTQTVTIPFATHHQKLHFTLSATSNSACANRWLVSFYVKVMSGDPVKIDAERTGNLIVIQR